MYIVADSKQSAFMEVEGIVNGNIVHDNIIDTRSFEKVVDDLKARTRTAAEKPRHPVIFVSIQVSQRQFITIERNQSGHKTKDTSSIKALHISRFVISQPLFELDSPPPDRIGKKSCEPAFGLPDKNLE